MIFDFEYSSIYGINKSTLKYVTGIDTYKLTPLINDERTLEELYYISTYIHMQH